MGEGKGQEGRKKTGEGSGKQTNWTAQERGRKGKKRGAETGGHHALPQGSSQVLFEVQEEADSMQVSTQWTPKGKAEVGLSHTQELCSPVPAFSGLFSKFFLTSPFLQRAQEDVPGPLPFHSLTNNFVT